MTLWILVAFMVLVVGLVVLDLGVLTRRPREVTTTEGALSVQLWVVAAVGVCSLLYKAYAVNWIPVSDPLRAEPNPLNALLQFLSAYVIEVALSLDNIVVLALLFAHFRVPARDRGRALFWVLVSSLLARGAMVALGVAVLSWDWTRWLFAALLLVAAARVFVLPDRPAHVEDRPFVRAARRYFGQRRGIWPVVAVAAAADVSFAVDSIPAVFSVTRDPLVAFMSNVMAVLLLRSLYFSLQSVVTRLRYLKIGLVVMLLGLAVKTAFFNDARLPTEITIAAVLLVVGGSAAASIPHMRRQEALAAVSPAPIEDVAEAIAATRRNLRKLAVLVAGTLVLLLAVIIGPLPGPGFTIVAPIGIAILATEFAWARGLLVRLKGLQDKTDRIAKRTSVWLVLPVVLGFWGILAIIAYLLHHFRPEVNVSTIFVLAGGGFVPIGFWAYRTVALHLTRRRAGTGKPANITDSP
ncbi:MAG: hypothetical protein JNM07_00275 [Phycisphaerae bacterium]|nr:hypothetical protein [Phycisphaerae bacterium]